MSENEFSSAFSSAFDAEGDYPVICIPVDWSCKTDEEMADITPAQRVRAEAFAQTAIQVLTGRQLGNCPITVRPCLAGCLSMDPSYKSGGGLLNPYLRNGKWYNTCGCNPTDCACTYFERIVLAGPVARIVEVKVDGVVIPSTDYRVDNHRELVPLNGQEWLHCQEMTEPDTEPGTMSVTYVRGAEIDALGAFVAGLLASEYLNACSGAECRLPSSVVSMARQGISYEFGESVFPNNKTGMDEVDLWVQSWNPYNVKSPSRVFSVDKMPHRQVTWRS